MLLFFTSFLAGVLTVLAPCILPLLPIILGSSIENRKSKGVFVLIGSLSVSIIAFTLLLRASTVFISIPNSFWTQASGIILILFGIITLYPKLWEHLAKPFDAKTKEAMSQAGQQEGMKKNIAIGLTLGPVFTSCSPTYALILATVLPASYVQGVFYTIVYTLGLASVLLLIAFLGRKFTKRLQSLSDPQGKFKQVLGIIFLVVGLSIFFGWDKDIEAYIIDQGYFGITSIEEQLVETIQSDQ